MARPKNKDGIRAKARQRDGIILVHFDEYPGHWIVSPEHERDKALAWAKRNRERLIRRGSTTIAELCKDFYSVEGQWVHRQKDKGHHYIDQHLRNRQAYLDNYFCKEFGHFKPQDIDRPDWRREFDNWLLYLTSYLDAEKNPADRKKLSRATKNKIIYSVNDFIEEMIEIRKMSHNPLTGLKKYNKDPENPRGIIDRESLEKMFPSSHVEMVRIWGSSMWACVMLMFYDTGARPTEVRALKWENIYFEKRFVPFRTGIEAGTADKIKGTKTNVVKAGFFNERTIQELSIWRSESRFNADKDFIFTAKGIKPITDAAITNAFRRGLAQIEKDNIKAKEPWHPNPKWTPYWLRHSFGTYQMENLKEDEIAALMGNGVVVLKKHYQHPDDHTIYKSTEEIREKLDKARNIVAQ